MAHRNPVSVILDTNKLTGPNYSDWLINIKIILASEKLTYLLTKSPPKEAAKGISPDELKKLETWWDHDLKAKCYMLASISNELQRRFENAVNAAIIHLHLKICMVHKQEMKDSFYGFVVNFNMNKIEATLEELVNMLTSFESTMKKRKQFSYLALRLV
ncbi:uncharacterized protein [Henckelia pumila]|uniref:uncharacterized protein n=1 Tax=Henckelia pumila TaxID=405737 RepID=UPI003C6E3D0A